MICPICGQQMTNLGNVSKTIYMSNPPQWDEVMVCYKDKVKKTFRIVNLDTEIIKPDISSYKELE